MPDAVPANSGHRPRGLSLEAGFVSSRQLPLRFAPLLPLRAARIPSVGRPRGYGGVDAPQQQNHRKTATVAAVHRCWGEREILRFLEQIAIPLGAVGRMDSRVQQKTQVMKTDGELLAAFVEGDEPPFPNS